MNLKKRIVVASKESFLKDFSKPIKKLGYDLDHALLMMDNSASIEAIIYKKKERMFHEEDIKKIEEIIGKHYNFEYQKHKYNLPITISLRSYKNNK